MYSNKICWIWIIYYKANGEEDFWLEGLLLILRYIIHTMYGREFIIIQIQFTRFTLVNIYISEVLYCNV